MVKRIEFPPRLANARYAIRDVAVKARELEKKGKRIIYLNSGDPLKHGFDIPQELKEEMCKAVQEHNRYGDPTGEESTREAIAIREKEFNGISLQPEHIVVGNGISEVFLLIATTLFDEGREVLIPGPTYPMYKSYVEFLGARAVEYECIEGEGWRPNIDDVRRKINKNTVAIVIINPNNPTGAVYSKRDVKDLVDVAAEHGIVVFSDEIYDHNILEGEFKSTASLTSYPVVGLNGISKALFATGWRFGYCYFHNPDDVSLEILENLKKVARLRSYTNLPVQKAVEPLLKKEPYLLKDVMERIRKARDFVYKRVCEIPHLSTTKPAGAFYLFPKILLKVGDVEFTEGLLQEEGIAFVHGSGFGEMGRGHFRIVYLGREEELEAAMDGLERYCKRLAERGTQ